MWSKVKTRVISATILIASVLVVLFLAPAWCVGFIVSIVTYAVLYELSQVLDLKRKKSVTIVNFLFATLFMTYSYFETITAVRFIVPAIVFYIITLSAIAVIDNEKVKFSDITASVFMVFYAVALLMHLTYIRKLDNGIALLILTLMGAYATDTGAYFTGMAIGKHKLIERISPNKTVEGAIGGTVANIIAFVIYGVVMCKTGYSINFVNLLILSVLCAVVAQLGDLTASAIKRNFSVKDFGNIIPGHGGIVDRVDSLMFVAPVVYHFITFLPVIQ